MMYAIYAFYDWITNPFVVFIALLTIVMCADDILEFIAGGIVEFIDWIWKAIATMIAKNKNDPDKVIYHKGDWAC